jgi:drug/metabolite transporter (DMT)-like permease
MAPPIGVVLGWLVLDEAIGWNLVAALGFILGGVALVQGVAVQRLWTKPPTAVAVPAPVD